MDSVMKGLIWQCHPAPRVFGLEPPLHYTLSEEPYTDCVMVKLACDMLKISNAGLLPNLCICEFTCMRSSRNHTQCIIHNVIYTRRCHAPESPPYRFRRLTYCVRLPADFRTCKSPPARHKTRPAPRSEVSPILKSPHYSAHCLLFWVSKASEHLTQWHLHSNRFH